MKKYELADVVVFTEDHHLDFPLSGTIKKDTIGVFLNIEPDVSNLFLLGDKIEDLDEWNNTLQVWNGMLLPVKSVAVEQLTFTQNNPLMQTLIDAYCHCQGLQTFTLKKHHIHQNLFSIPDAISLIKSLAK